MTLLRKVSLIGAPTDIGAGDIAPERMGEDFFNYRPFHLWRDPPRAMLARVANMVQAAMDSGKYAGGIWLEGSPNIEETLMWMNLLIDTTLPICGNSSREIGVGSVREVQFELFYTGNRRIQNGSP